MYQEALPCFQITDTKPIPYLRKQKKGTLQYAINSHLCIDSHVQIPNSIRRVGCEYNSPTAAVAIAVTDGSCSQGQIFD
jgi:hypothetical protein